MQNHENTGNLGAIDSQYDIAVTTASPQLDNFVVDTAVGAQQCVEYLRSIQGRGKFIILEEVRTCTVLCLRACCMCASRQYAWATRGLDGPFALTSTVSYSWWCCARLHV